MKSASMVAGLLAFGLSVPALAQAPQTPQTQTTPMQSSGAMPQAPNGQQQPPGAQAQNQTPHQNAAALRQDIKQELQQAGFTNIRVMPASFLVHARDKQGRMVEMIVSPNSVVAMTGPAGMSQSGKNMPSTATGQ